MKFIRSIILASLAIAIASCGTLGTNGSSVKTSTVRSTIANEQRLVVVEFYADWCLPCKKFSPIAERVANRHGDKMVLLKVDIDKNTELADEVEVDAVPFIQFYRGGQILHERRGLISEAAFEALVLQYSN